MATFAHWWKLNEGTGTAAADSIGSLNGTLEGSSLPQWVVNGGYTALRFPGEDGGAFLASASDCARVDCNGSITCDIDGSAYAMACWINLNGSSASKVILRNGVRDAPTNDYGPPIDFLYLGTNGVACFGISLAAGATAVRKSAIGTTTLAGTTGWHHVLGQFVYDEGPDSTRRYAKIYVDGVLENTLTGDALDIRSSYATRDFFIGQGLAYWRDTTIHWPHTNYTGTDDITNGSFNGDILDVRVYCGLLTDEEVEDIYNDGPVVQAARRTKIFTFSGGLA